MTDYYLFFGGQNVLQQTNRLHPMSRAARTERAGCFEHCRRIRFGIATTVTTTMTELELRF